MLAQRGDRRGFVQIAAVGVPLFLSISLSSCFPTQPSHGVLAKVIRIRAEGASIPTTVIVISTPDGLTATERIPPSELTCHVGQIVHAVRTGVSLALRDGECATYK
jgi:hypothetical protein